MENEELIDKVINFKIKLSKELVKAKSDDLKANLWKMVILTEIAHKSFSLNINIELFEKNYFERYSAVARYFRDWGLDWIADEYFFINKIITNKYWPNTE